MHESEMIVSAIQAFFPVLVSVNREVVCWHLSEMHDPEKHANNCDPGLLPFKGYLKKSHCRGF